MAQISDGATKHIVLVHGGLLTARAGKTCTKYLRVTERKRPTALTQVAENDILRDEGEAYGLKLDEAGVKVTTVRYDGMIHGFGLLNGLAGEPAVRSLFEHAAAELKHYLQP